jgi:hypothetical protein
MDTILSQYIQDKSIPVEKRQRLASDLDSGKIDEKTARGIIMQKYPGKFTPVDTKSEKGAAVYQSSWNLMPQAKKDALMPVLGEKRDLGEMGAEIDQKLTQKNLENAPDIGGTIQKGLDIAGRGIQAATNPIGFVQGQMTENIIKETPEFSQATPEEQKSAVDQVNPNIASLPSAVYRGTVEPMGQLALGTAGTSYAGAKGAVAQISELLKSGDWQKAQEVADKAMAEPVNFGKDNINWFKGDEEGGLDRGASALSVAGEGARGAAGAINTFSIFNPAMATNVWANATAGGALSLGDTIREGGSNWDMALNTMLGAGVQGGLSFLLGRLTKSKEPIAPADALKDKALRNGVKEQYANALSPLDDGQKRVAIDYLEAGLQKLDDPIRTPNNYVFKYASKESGVDDFLLNMEDLRSTLGKQVGATKQGLKSVNLNPAPIKKEANSIFRTLNAKIRKNGVDFSTSDIANNQSAINQLDDIYTKISKKTINARDLEAVTSQIDQTTGLLKASGVKSGDPAIEALKQIKKVINKTIGEADQGFGAANQRFAQFIKDYNKVKNAAKVVQGNGQVTYDGAQILRRYEGNAPAKYQEAIDAMNRLAKEYGLTAPKNIPERAFLADLAEKFTGTSQPQSLKGSIEGAMDAVPGKIGTITKGIKSAKQYFTGKGLEPLRDQTKSLIDLLEGSLSKGKTAIPKAKMKEVLEVLTNYARLTAGKD